MPTERPKTFCPANRGILFEVVAAGRLAITRA
jgi:hypothetical protein